MGKILISVTMDWEGEHLNNIDFVSFLKKKTNNIPLTHFICPSYFIRNNQKKIKKIQKVLAPEDEIGLHIHCYRALIEKIAGVAFRDTPNYYEGNTILHKLLPVHLQRRLKMISGRGVPLSAYEPDEISVIIRNSRRRLEKILNTGRIESFRAGGWMASDHVFKALREQGFLYDSSAVPPEILSQGYNKNESGSLRDDYADSNGVFTAYVIKMWGYELQHEYFLRNHEAIGANKYSAITKSTQPFNINGIYELPNNGALSDFASEDKTMRATFNEAKDLVQRTGKDYFMCIGCHMEGTWDYKMPLIRFLLSLSDQELSMIRFVTIREAGQWFKGTAVNRLYK